MQSVFDKFGGFRPMATAIGVPPSTVMSWQKKRKIPGWRHASILQAAKRLGRDVKQADLENIPPFAPKRPATAQQDAA